MRRPFSGPYRATNRNAINMATVMARGRLTRHCRLHRAKRADRARPLRQGCNCRCSPALYLQRVEAIRDGLNQQAQSAEARSVHAR